MQFYSTREVAKMTGLSEIRVRKAAEKLAVKWEGRWVWDDEAVSRLKDRMGKRGNPNWKSKIKEKERWKRSKNRS